jgi:rod shape-determining protein MreC
MESVLGRYRNLIILVGVLFLQVLGLAVQVKRGSADVEKTRLIRIWAVGAISPFERCLVWVENSGSNVWHNYFYLHGVRAENRQLKEQIEQMRLEQVRLSEDAAQAHRLQTLLAFKEQYIAKTVAAQVIGSSGSDLSRVIYIDKGDDAGLKRDMAVITADGIVGKILVVYPFVSQVLLINDQSSGVGVILEKSRLQGVLRGTANGEVVLERVMSDEQVPVGETVLTSGGDQIFPKGMPVGTVSKVANGKDLFLNIKVKPAADLSKLEEVLVLAEKQDRQATAEDTTHVRAADILAQRLPSVPDKPPTDGSGAATGAGTTTPPGSSAATRTTAGNTAAGATKVPSAGSVPAAQSKATAQAKTAQPSSEQPKVESASQQPKTQQPTLRQSKPEQPGTEGVTEIKPQVPAASDAADTSPKAAAGTDSITVVPKPAAAPNQPVGNSQKPPKPATTQTSPQPSGDQNDPH